MKASCSILLVLVCVSFTQGAQAADDVEQRVYETRRLEGEAPHIDGAVTEPAWDGVSWSGEFVQREPTDGDPPCHQSQFKVVYDDDAIYFAFRLEDDPEQMSSLLARRDQFPGDWIEVNIGSYADRRTAFSFTLSLSGTRGEELVSNDGESWNSSWDPVWTGATRAQESGWTAEMRIPLSQLRFSEAATQVWGLQVNRRHFHLGQLSSWQRIPKDVSGWVSHFGELRGLENLRPGRHVELLPYVVARAEHLQAEENNPFQNGRENGMDGGLDGKIGVTNNLTLDLTINPDFGQVEADPSEVNLTAFETYLTERRPFFIEGSDIFDLRLAPAITGGSFTQDTLFYSRRIGQRPGYQPDLGNAVATELPESTTILGAFKLSGKTSSGLSIGLVESLTDEESIWVEEAGQRRQVTVEPLTNYLVCRLQQDFANGDTQLGGMITAVKRDLQDELVELLPGEAFAGGLDLSTYFRDRDYRLQANIIASELRGDPTAIDEIQTSSAHYLQRPDLEGAVYDPARTSLRGHAGSLRFGRTNNHDLRFETGVAWRSPGFEINDLGYMRNANQVNQFTWVGYVKRNPFSVFDSWSLNGNQWLDWDFGGTFLGARYNVNSHATFRTKYSAGFNLTRTGEHTSNTELRGGPSSRLPGYWETSAYLNTDHRKAVRANLSVYLEQGDEGSSRRSDVWTNVSFRPTNALEISLGPSYSSNRTEMQYVSTEQAGAAPRYLFASLDQKVLAVTLRVNWTIAPNLTVQLYAEPFLATGRYAEFKRITDPMAGRYRDRFASFAAGQVTWDQVEEVYAFDENGDGSVEYSRANPDFDVRELNSNLVIRWEFRPGSTAYLVWSQARSNNAVLVDELDPNRDLRHLFATHPHNVILLKVSKWFTP